MSDCNLTTGFNVTSQASHAANNEGLNWPVLLAIPVIAAVAAGNLLVITAVLRNRKLQTSTNYFLTSLAAADLLVACTVMPPSLAMIANYNVWPMDDRACAIWLALDVLFSTASILHLCMLSFDRYLALARPFRHRNRDMPAVGLRLSQDRAGQAKLKRRVIVRIFIVWLLSFGIALPLPVLGMGKREFIFNGDSCAISDRYFAYFGSLFAFFLPLVVMFVMYTLTIRILHRQALLVANMRATPSSARQLNERRLTVYHKAYPQQQQHDPPQQQYDVPANDCCEPGDACAYYATVTSQVTRSPTTANRPHRGGWETAPPDGRWWSRRSLAGSRPRLAISNFCMCRCVARKPSEDEVECQPRQPTSPGRRDTGTSISGGEHFSHHSAADPHRKSVTPSFKKRAMATINTEQRASKVLGLIFILFCVFWMPFFVTNVVRHIYDTCDKQAMEVMGNYMDWFAWVGYVSSGVNPCVYTLFSKRFRTTFYHLLRCRFESPPSHLLAYQGSSIRRSSRSFHHKRSSCSSASDNFGQFRKSSESFGQFRKSSDGLGKLRKSSDNFGQFQKTSDNFGENDWLRGGCRVADDSQLLTLPSTKSRSREVGA